MSDYNENKVFIKYVVFEDGKVKTKQVRSKVVEKGDNTITLEFVLNGKKDTYVFKEDDSNLSHFPHTIEYGI